MENVNVKRQVNKEMKISIIVPVYNGEKYISECLDSLLGQTYHNIEIIIINDGSTDSTSTILAEYKKKDGRLVIIDQKNQGAGAARNTGIQKVTGVFLMFVDSDDYLLKDCIERVVEAIDKNPKVSLVNWGSQTFGQNESIVNCMPDRIFSSGEEYTKHLLENGGGTGGVCGKAYRTTLILDNDLRFGSFKTAEDGHFNAVCLKYLSEVINLDYVGYMYRKEDYVYHSTTHFFQLPNFFLSSVDSASCRLSEIRSAMNFFKICDGYYWELYYKSEYYTFQVVNDENAIYNYSFKNKLKCNKQLLLGVLSKECLDLQKKTWKIKWLYRIYEKKSGIELYLWNYFRRGFVKSLLVYIILGRMFPRNTKRGMILRKGLGH